MSIIAPHPFSGGTYYKKLSTVPIIDELNLQVKEKLVQSGYDVLETPTLAETTGNDITHYRLYCGKGPLINGMFNFSTGEINNVSVSATNIVNHIITSPFHTTTLETKFYDIQVVYQNDDSYSDDQHAYNNLFVYYHTNTPHQTSI